MQVCVFYHLICIFILNSQFSFLWILEWIAPKNICNEFPSQYLVLLCCHLLLTLRKTIKAQMRYHAHFKPLPVKHSITTFKNIYL